MSDKVSRQRRLFAFVGSYGAAPGSAGGGVYVLAVDGGRMELVDRAESPREAGYIVYARDTGTIYVVDERKTDGRGPVDAPAAVHALAVDRGTGRLAARNRHWAPGPRPTYLAYDARRRLLVCANHGDFQHVEKVVRRADGGWSCEYVYDDSTVIVYGLQEDGCIEGIRDVQVLDGHGTDPNGSPQNGGHAQASPHAHSAVIDPSGNFLLVCDKGTDRIYSYRMGSKLELVATCQFPPETAPRHLAFAPGGKVYATLELSSEVAVLDFSASSGELKLIGRASTVAQDHAGPNEPAELRVHPNGRWIYVNNRGEDSLACLRVLPDGGLQRTGAVGLARSIHPGLAARSFDFDPSGSFMLVADRPAHLVRAFAVDAEAGHLAPIGEFAVPDPVYVEFALLDGEVSE